MAAQLRWRLGTPLRGDAARSAADYAVGAAAGIHAAEPARSEQGCCSGDAHSGAWLVPCACGACALALCFEMTRCDWINVADLNLRCISNAFRRPHFGCPEFERVCGSQTRLRTTSSTFEVTPRAHSLHSPSFEATEQSTAAALHASDQTRKSSDLANGISK